MWGREVKLLRCSWGVLASWMGCRFWRGRPFMGVHVPVCGNQVRDCRCAWLVALVLDVGCRHFGPSLSCLVRTRPSSPARFCAPRSVPFAFSVSLSSPLVVSCFCGLLCYLCLWDSFVRFFPGCMFLFVSSLHSFRDDVSTSFLVRIP